MMSRSSPRRRIVDRLATCLAVVVSMSLVLLATGSAGAQTKVTLGVSGVSEGKLPLFVAEQQGFFREAGIAPEFVEFRSGGAVVQAFVGSGVDLCVCAADHAILLRSRGLDVRIIAGLNAHSPNALVTANPAVTGIASLRGKKIGITSPGSSTDNLIRWSLTKAGLRPDLDVQLVTVGTGPPMRAAIESRSIDAGILGAAELLDADLKNTGLRVVTDFRTVPAAALNVLARRTWVDKNPELARAFVKAVTRGAKRIQSDPDAAAAAARTMFPQRDERFSRALAEQTAKVLSPDGSVSEEAFANVVSILAVAEPNLEVPRLSDVDLQPVLAR